MTFYNNTPRAASHADRDCADFARQATIAAFGWRFAKALDEGGFVDRQPGELPKPSA